ncbi:MAG: TIGR04141 family sporadically distributed protein, partial [Dehalococcoidia bacterium]
ITKDDLKAPSSRTTSAVLAIRLAKSGPYARTVCFTFGYGRHLLDPSRLERDFGLLLALNAVDPQRLRAFDARRQDDVVVNSRVQASAGTDLTSFDLDEHRDIFRSAAGTTLSEHTELLGSMVRGSVGVTFDAPIDVGDLAARARQLLRLYRKDFYRESFPFVDHVRPVDEPMAESLDNRLGDALRKLSEGKDTGFKCLYLAIPDVIDIEQTEGFTFSSEYGNEPTVHSNLSLDFYLATRRGRASPTSIGRTKTDYVNRRVEGQVDYRLATVYRCLVAEVDRAGKTYQLVDGSWYAVAAEFVARVRGEIADIPLSPVAFPELEPGEDEGDYNDRAAAHLGGICLDARNVGIGGGRNRLEVCDIALQDRTLIFAKKRAASSTLSHLWFQATVSMQALLSDGDYRVRVREKIDDLDPAFAIIAQDGLEGRDFSVDYLVLGVDPDSPAAHLPFFSQVALWQAHRTLRSMAVP